MTWQVVFTVIGVIIIVWMILRIIAKITDHNADPQQRGYELTSQGIIAFSVARDGTRIIIAKFPVTQSCRSIEHIIEKRAEHYGPPDLMPEQKVETLDLTMVRDAVTSVIPGIDGKGIKKIKTRAKFDGREYHVRDFPDYQEAAEVLARLNSDAYKLLDYLKSTEPDSSYTQALLRNYDGKLEEETPKNLENLTSYTIDKEKIISCLRTKGDNHSLHDYNLLLYVFIHEMSHMANDRSYGHDVLFDQSFEFLLKRATDLGILKRIDFEKNPVNFCGLPITVNVDY
jgi:hypothetical protein